MLHTDKDFKESIAEVYERYLVPFIFEPYAIDIVDRLSKTTPARILELAAGTGVVTRFLASRLPASTEIVATDLNQDMLTIGQNVGTARTVTWQQSDAMQLQYDDASFNAVLCQFGVMFFPDRVQAYAQTYRVLKPNGIFIFNVWDTTQSNPVTQTVHDTLQSFFTQNPPQFLSRTPYSYNNKNIIKQELEKAGFTQEITFSVITKSCHAPSAEQLALAYCQGTPLRFEIESHGAKALEEATDAVAQSIAKKFGKKNITAPMQAVVVQVVK